MKNLLRKLIIFLVRKRLGLKKYQEFQFDNQKSKLEHYWFNDTELRKMREDGVCEDAHVSLNWLLNDNCKVNVIDLETLFGVDDWDY